MILKDDVVLLRAIEESDAHILMNLINDPEVENSVFGWSYPVSLSSQKKWILNISDDTTVRYIIDVDEEAVGVAIISSIDMKNRTSNMNIKLLKSARGKGIATRTLSLIIRYCFDELNMHCLTANVIERNESSRKLWIKLGFNEDGILRQRIYKNGVYHNIVSYSLLKEEYYGRNR
ncbi:GNAT family protein [Ruminococcus sp.]|uniref:GNAT family N-acetyltransferase n=1 Tax=Ruminococcus sp. TaxID=41978 RepID=UPI0025F4AB09|nr:GNAT family protein [Ruminococcus sp.]